MCLCGGTCNCSFWVQARNNGNATTDYVVGSLHEGFYERDDGGTHIPYYPSEDDEKVEWSDGEDEIESEDRDSDLSKEGKIFCLVVDSCVMC